MKQAKYFEAPSMRELFDLLQTWQEENNTRLLSVSVEQDGGKFCCIALTNPVEVVICSGLKPYQLGVTKGGYLQATLNV